MDEKETYQEISFVLKRGRKDLRKCLDIIKQHGGEIMDVFRYYSVITAVVPIKYVHPILDDMRAAGARVRMVEGITLDGGRGIYSYIFAKQEFGPIKTYLRKYYIHHIAQWYAFQFMRKNIVSSDRILYIACSYPFCVMLDELQWTDGYEVHDMESEMAIDDKAIRVVHAIGSGRKYPYPFHLYKRLTWMRSHGTKLKDQLERGNYYVYLVYNLRLGRSPKLVELNSMFIKKYGGDIDKDGEITVRNVSKGVRENGITVHTLPCYTESINRLANEFFELV